LGERHEDRLAMRHRIALAADHETVAVLQSQIPPLVPESMKRIPSVANRSARAMESLYSEIAAIDQNVALGEMGSSVAIVSSTGWPAGTMIQITRGDASWLATSTRSFAPLAPSS